MLWVFTDNADDAVSLDYLTLVADRFYTGSYFHKSPPGNHANIFHLTKAVRSDSNSP